MTDIATDHQIAEEDALRADLYSYLSALLASPPNRELIARTAALTSDDTPLGKSFATLVKLAKATTPAAVEREFNALFIGLARGELLPYASYYMTGFLNEKPLALLRADMAAHGISRAPNVYEPEDNIASLLEMMAGMIEGRFGPPASLEAQKTFFNRHLAPWAQHFFTDLEGAKGSVFYAPVGAIGKIFMTIEREAFRLGGQ
ncbi:molecular chaperone TorD [Pseudorhodobacter sp. E13]|uniref:TorD/DmsD family molecular chaperone n=1 Tax=Pseudorhodobacter sp. E13 TaxID=2487931 RepID=UPI000F8F118E|nr:molecular chaperone TorD family protein [Pseudorhodobacter sp. E13]RUS59243.1 molecular chaperone TorD [Pseudorhodobacter sp. E13]